MARKHPEQAFIPAFCEPLPIFLVVLFCELIAIFITLVRSPLPNVDWLALGETSLFVVWLGLLSAGVLCALRRRLSPYSLTKQVSISFFLVLLVTLVASMFVMVMLNFEPWWLINNLIFACLVVGIAMRYFMLHYQFRIQQQAELKQRIEALQARIRPHFLFNALNAIATMIEIEPEKAEAMTLDLADITRDSLRAATLVSLADELSLCRRYVDIESYRFGERLALSWQIDEDALPIRLPNFLLQPLIENAIYHGIQRRLEGGLIEVSAKIESNTLMIRVVNPLPDIDAEQVSGQQIAIANIQNRLKAVFGPFASCELSRFDDCFQALVSLPVTANASKVES